MHPTTVLTHRYLTKAGYPHDIDEINLQLIGHPNFPSVIAIHDLFNHLNVDHIALKLDKDKIETRHLPKYYMAHFDDDKGERLGIVEQSSKKISVDFGNEGQVYGSKEDFTKQWSGILIAFKEISTTPISITRRKLPKGMAIPIALFLSMAMVTSISSANIFQLVFMALSLIGLFTNTLIVRKEFGFKSRSIQKFCTFFEKASCDVVTNSKGASFFGIAKLSDIGIIYFTTQFLLILLALFSTYSMNTLIVFVSYLTVPFAFYSIIYQGAVLRKWCPLCIIVVSVLLAQFLFALFFNNSTFSIPSLSVIATGLAILLPIGSVWLTIRPFLEAKKNEGLLKLENLRFRRNMGFFQTALAESTGVPYTLLKDDMVFGNPNADVELMLITNPVCGYCRDSHTVLEKVIKNHGKNLKVIVRFSLPQVQNTESTELRLAHYILHKYRFSGSKDALMAMHEIYHLDKEERKGWLENHDLIVNHDLISLLKEQTQWAIENEVQMTPTFSINKKVFPRNFFKHEDLDFLIPNLIEATGIKGVHVA